MIKFKSLFNTKKKITIFSVLVLLIIGLLLYFLVFNNKEPEEPAKPGEKYYSKLTGKEVSKEEANRPILAVMINNSQEARPQTGLDTAGIVFEAVTEGGITRYMALYQDELPEIVGPVRSIRTHFLDWLMGYEASVAHVGGSEEALDQASSRKARSLNEFKYSEAYYKDRSRSSPHNMYARIQDLRNLQSELKQTNSTFTVFERKDSKPSDPVADSSQADQSLKNASSINIDYSSALYKVEFRYDETNNNYVRYLAGKPHLDQKTNQPITVKNLVVLKVRELGAGVEAIGTGEAIIFNNGEFATGKWKKDSFSSSLLLIDENGNNLPLLRGDSWIAAVGANRLVKY